MDGGYEENGNESEMLRSPQHDSVVRVNAWRNGGREVCLSAKLTYERASLWMQSCRDRGG